MKSLLMFGLVSLICAPVFASTYTGAVQTVIVQASSSGGTRVSILTSAATACPSYNGSFAFEFAGTSGPGASWLAGLYAAKAAGAEVAIYGTGACDQYGVEVVNYIYFY